MDALVDEGLTCITVLDISEAALDRARARLGFAAGRVTWVRGDVTDPAWQPPSVDLWHDRAVFHFLTAANDRRAYVAHLHSAVEQTGKAIVATFAPDGPEQCSGLPVQRYSAHSLGVELGEAFELLASEHEAHETPAGRVQSFQWSRFGRRAAMAPS